LQSRVEELSAVKGWITPVFTREDPVTKELHHLISMEDGERIARGYACGECGAIYDMVMPACVVCSEPIALELAPMRQEWTDHLKDREELPQYGKPLSADEFIAEVMKDPNIEQRKL
jgi:hypothetical protein